MFEKIYTYSSHTFVGTFFLYFEIASFLAIAILVVFRSRRIVRKKCATVIISLIGGLIFYLLAVFSPSGKSESDTVSEISGHILILRECRYIAGSLPGEFSIGGKILDYGLNSKNYAVTDIVKNANPSEEYRIKYNSEGIVIEMWRRQDK